MLRNARLHCSPNAGWPEAAMAGALGLSLAGPRRYPGLVVDDPWIGSGSSRATARDVFRALLLFASACVLNAFWWRRRPPASLWAREEERRKRG
ncbi:MAG: cobalamin biosynthesis protein [Rhodospirillales bacterium]